MKTAKLLEARENAYDQGVAIVFIFASDWLRGWRQFSGPITEQSQVKPIKAMPDDFRHSIENCCNC